MRKDWARWHPRGTSLRFLCVCTRGALRDTLVTRDAREVADFLAVPDAAGVVISTYQSVPVLIEAQRGAPAFDLALFDEAHRTAGAGGLWSQALDDTRLPCAQRLFFTATPRLSEMGNYAVAMDDESLYGSTWHCLRFSEARRRGLIAPYRLEILLLDPLGEADGDADSAALIEGALRDRRPLLAKAVQEHVRERGKAVVYSSSNKRADDFAAALRAEGSAPVYAVRGGPSKERDTAMEALRREDRCIVSNCRCLQEGIDVPSLELVVIADPKSSAVDIVQLAGRVMRKAPGKTYGTILAPVIKVKGDGALYGTKGFDIALKVLDALQDHDDELRDALRAARERRGYKGSLTAEEIELALGDRVVVRDETGIVKAGVPQRERVLTAAIRLSGSSWDEKFGGLLAYKEEYGHCDVPQKYEPNVGLGHWVNWQREALKAGRLSADRKQRLESLGFTWSMWTRSHGGLSLQDLEDFVEANGRLPCHKGDSRLYQWLQEKKKLMRESQLPGEEVQRLAALGVQAAGVQDKDAMWAENYRQLEELFASVGHFRKVPDKKLAVWCTSQRQVKIQGKMTEERVELLDKLAFPWDAHEAKWRWHVQKLQAHHDRGGDANDFDSEMKPWVASLRASFTAGLDKRPSGGIQLTDERLAELRRLRLTEALFGHLEKPSSLLCTCNSPPREDMGAFANKVSLMLYAPSSPRQIQSDCHIVRRAAKTYSPSSPLTRRAASLLHIPTSFALNTMD
jgi:hypothetical protein